MIAVLHLLRRDHRVLRGSSILVFLLAACTADREARPIDVLSGRYCRETADAVGRQVTELRIITQQQADVLRISEAIHHVRDGLNLLKGRCEKQPGLSERVQRYEEEVDAIEEKYVWGHG